MPDSTGNRCTDQAPELGQRDAEELIRRALWALARHMQRVLGRIATYAEMPSVKAYVFLCILYITCKDCQAWMPELDASQV